MSNWQGEAERWGVTVESVDLVVDQEVVPTVVCRPRRALPNTGVVLATEAQGINNFIRGVGVTLASHGYLAVIPDYYHGSGPTDPDALVDLAHMDELLAAINSLDFRRGAEDVLAAVTYVRHVENVDAVAVWGYCTGGTLAWLAAELGRDVDAAVLYYPSQPTFHELSVTRPQHAIDMIWQMRCPTLLLVGSEDPVWPPEVVEEVTNRFKVWSIPFEKEVYGGAGHTFAGYFADWHRPDAAAASMERALSFLAGAMPGAERDPPSVPRA